MSDTPRTDAKSVRFSTLCAERDQWWVSRETSRQLERELAAANERIRRLEAAGNALDNSVACGCGIDGPCNSCRKALDEWRQAKEAKP